MYKSLTRLDWLDLLKFPSNYAVDALVIAGTPGREKHYSVLENVLNELTPNYSIKQFVDKPFVRGYEITLNGKVIWFDTSYGSAYLSEITHISSILGSKKNILVGACGGINEEIKSLDIIIPNYSYGNESTTRAYQKQNTSNNHPADTELSSDLTHLFSSKYSVFNKPLMTCQAHLGESMEDIQNWCKDGYYGVEMESASMFAVSNHFNVPSAAVIHVNDNLISGEHVGSINNNLLKKQREVLIKDKYMQIIKYLLNTLG